MGYLYQLSTLTGTGLDSAIYAMMAACFLPFVWAMIAKWRGGFVTKNNQNPRVFWHKQQDLPAVPTPLKPTALKAYPCFWLQYQWPYTALYHNLPSIALLGCMSFFALVLGCVI